MKKCIKTSLLISLINLCLYSQEKLNYDQCVEQAMQVVEPESIEIIEEEHFILIGDITHPLCLFDFKKKSYYPNQSALEDAYKNLVFFEDHANDLITPRSKNNIIPITSDFDLEWANYSYTEQNRWTTLNIPFYISKEFSEDTVIRLKKAIRTIENSSMVRFIPIPDDQFCLDQAEAEELNCPEDLPNKRVYYVKIDPYNKPEETLNFIYIRKAGNPGYFGSELGKKPSYYISAATRVTVGGLVTETIATHELLHALGLDHTFCRYDRDKYITMNWSHEVHQNLSGQFIRNNIANEYLNFYEIINGASGDYINSELEYVSDLVEVNTQASELNFEKLFNLDPYHLLGSEFNTHSILFYPNGRGFNAQNGDEVKVTLQALPYENQIIDDFENGLWTYGLAEEDGNRLSFHLMHKDLLENFSSAEFNTDESLPSPQYIRTIPGESSFLHVGLPDSIENYDQIGLYALFYRGNSANPNSLLPYGGAKVIHLDHLSDKVKSGEVQISLNRLDQAKVDFSQGGKFNTDLFGIHVGFYRVSENAPDINFGNYDVIRYLGPATKISIRKINGRLKEEINPLTPVLINNLKASVFPNPVANNAPININLENSLDFNGEFMYEVKLYNLTGQLIGSEVGTSSSNSIIWNESPFLQGVGLLKIRVKPTQSHKWSNQITKKIIKL